MKTMILGASNNKARYSFRAAEMLDDRGLDFVPVGIKKGEVLGKPILNGQPDLADIHTITLYVGPQNQPAWYDYLLALKPQRLIFNPGTENRELKQLAENQGIEVIEGCTLVMLATNSYKMDEVR